MDVRRSRGPWTTCNLSRAADDVRAVASSPRRARASCTGGVTTIGSDWDDIDAVVDHLREALTCGEGQPCRVVARRAVPGDTPSSILRRSIGSCSWRQRLREPQIRPPMRRHSECSVALELVANWDRQVGARSIRSGCRRQRMVGDAGLGFRWRDVGIGRASRVQCAAGRGLGSVVHGQSEAPDSPVAGVHDKQVDPSSVRQLHAAIGATDKV